MRKIVFEQYIEQYKRLIYTVCLSFVRNPFDAEDLAQETFISAFRHLDGFDGENPKAWLTTIAANKCRDFLKSPARRVYATEESDFDCICDPSPTVEEESERRLGNEDARALCMRLKEPYRSVALEYFCAERTLSEISERTGDNLKTVATRLYRAKKLLKILIREGSEVDAY